MTTLCPRDWEANGTSRMVRPTGFLIVMHQWDSPLEMKMYLKVQCIKHTVYPYFQYVIRALPSVVLFPQIQNPSVTMRKTSNKSKWRGILQYT